jgi:hypothetical protein
MKSPNIFFTRVREIDQSCQTWPAKDWHKISNLQYKINEDWHFFHWDHQTHMQFRELWEGQVVSASLVAHIVLFLVNT